MPEIGDVYYYVGMPEASHLALVTAVKSSLRATWDVFEYITTLSPSSPRQMSRNGFINNYQAKRVAQLSPEEYRALSSTGERMNYCASCRKHKPSNCTCASTSFRQWWHDSECGELDFLQEPAPLTLVCQHEPGVTRVQGRLICKKCGDYLE